MRLEALPFAVALTLLAALPSYFNLATEQIFEEEKALLLRAGALIAVPALITMWRSDMRRMLADPIVLLFGALLAMLGLATIFAIAPHDALMGAHLRRHGFLTWAAVAVLFMAILPAVRATSGRDLVVRALVIGAAWPSIYLLLQRAGVDPIQWIAPSEGFKAGSTFGNHVMLGGYLAMVIPLTALECWRSSRAWVLLLLLEMAALMASASRGAALALAAGTATAAAVLIWRQAPRRVALGVTSAALVAAVLMLGVPSLRPSVVSDQLDPQIGSARVRILIWQDTIEIVRRSGARMLIGHGPDSLRALFPANYSPEIGYWEQIDAMPDRAHNETLDMLVTAGVAGALLELAVFALALIGALRIEDVALRCALAAAIVAHVVELQFGVASATTRLCFVAVIALVIGARWPGRDERARPTMQAWIAVAALAGALAPAASILPSLLNNPPASGGEAEFIGYLDYLALGIPVVYAAFLLIALVMARALSSGARSESAWWRIPLLGAGVWVAAMTCIAASRADALAAAGHSYEREQRWAEAAVAYRAAAVRLPGVADYQSNLGRASVEWAVRSEPPMRHELLDRARTAFQRAVDLTPFDIEAQRRLAAYPRIKASFVDDAERRALLEQSDRAYAALSAAAPTSPAVWVEWAWVDADRGRTDEATRKVERALGLNARHPAALALRGRLK